MQKVDQLTTRTILLGAAQVMRKYGHARGMHLDNQNRVCVIGAIRRYLALNTSYKSHVLSDVEQLQWDMAANAAEHEVRLTLIRTGESRTGMIAQWSDNKCSGTEEAAQLLERAAGVVPVSESSEFAL